MMSETGTPLSAPLDLDFWPTWDRALVQRWNDYLEPWITGLHHRLKILLFPCVVGRLQLFPFPH